MSATSGRLSTLWLWRKVLPSRVMSRSTQRASVVTNRCVDQPGARPSRVGAVFSPAGRIGELPKSSGSFQPKRTSAPALA